MNTTKLNYLGNVLIKLKLSNGEIIELKNHNHGESALMQSICKFLTNNSDGTADIPKYLDLRCQNAVTGIYESYLRTTPNLSATSYEFSSEYNNWIAKFTSAIDYDMLNNTIQETDVRNFRLYLISGESNDGTLKDLAYLSTTAAELSRISPGTIGIIDWIMQVANAS